MNLNYVGSVAERFMKFRSTLATEENVDINLFNAVSIYVPKSLAASNLASGSYDADEVTAEKYAVIPVTVDNYIEVFEAGSYLLSKWLPVFNDGTNSSVTLYIIVFDDTGFEVTATAESVTWAPLTKAFNELYFISFFKTMFSEHCNGKKVEDEYDDSNYFDMVLALSALCETESTLSWCLSEATLEVPEGTDENACKVMSHTRGDETTHCTTLAGTTKEDRAEYVWGYINLIGGKHTTFDVHNGSFMTPIYLGKWFEKKNDSGEFVGNKLAKIRLTGNKVKPTGLPSPLNSDVNLNLPKAIYTILDEKNVGYYMSISDSSLNNAQKVRDRSVGGLITTAYMISKCIDYNASQAMAEYSSASTSLTDPVLANEKTYTFMQSILLSQIQKFTGTGRIVGISIEFPPFSEAKVGNAFKGTAVWSAVYVDDLESVDVSGSISF